MNFIYEQPLQEYMLKKGKNTIVIEEITSNNSDFEITELHVHLVDKKRAAFFKNQKRYTPVTTDKGEVLLPPYHLKYDDTVTFGLKSFLGIKYVTYSGIH